MFLPLSFCLMSLRAEGVRGSWFVVRGSWFVVRGSWFVVKKCWLGYGPMRVVKLLLWVDWKLS